MQTVRRLSPAAAPDASPVDGYATDGKLMHRISVPVAPMTSLVLPEPTSTALTIASTARPLKSRSGAALTKWRVSSSHNPRRPGRCFGARSLWSAGAKSLEGIWAIRICSPSSPSTVGAHTTVTMGPRTLASHPAGSNQPAAERGDGPCRLVRNQRQKIPLSTPRQSSLSASLMQ